MAGLSGHWAFAFGLLGNIVSFMVYLAPIPTFRQIYKKKSSEGFQSIPYVVALFSAMIWIYYAFLKSNTTLLITINSVGCLIETVYILLFIFYASKKARVETVKLLVLLVVCGTGLVGVTQFVVKASERANVVGWFCLILSLCVFIAPLCIVRQVIQTKSVEHMPFLLSLFLTLSAVMWFFYGLLLKDHNIAIPNVLGFSFGVLQMVLYGLYKHAKKIEKQEQIMVGKEQQKSPEITETIIEIVKRKALLSSPEKIRSSKNGVEASVRQSLPKEIEI
ncbi:hypothetical protein ABFS83_04G120600 [Erythranthe nasuta]